MEKSQKEFKPYIPADKVLPEFTATSIILGVILAIVFGGANAYLGLRVGLTVSASIPAAVISMGIIRVIMKKDSILENNMVQTVGSAGESLASGAIFTLPAIFMWAAAGEATMPSYLTMALVCICGGLLGISFMIPLRNALIVKEHGTLPYPEGTACAEVLIAGEKGGAAAKAVFSGLGIAAVFKFLADGIKLFPSEVDWPIKKFDGAGIGMDTLPALAGVGYIVGPRVSAYMLSGGLFSWFLLMPLIKTFGGDMVMFPAKDPISSMSTWDIWGNYIRYIGAGAVAAAGIISLVKSFPLIIKTFAENIKSLKSKNNAADTLDRTQQDLGFKWIGLMILISMAVLILWPSIPLGIGSALLILVFGFFFATVSSRMVGIVGSSNNPVSGMAIATLLISTIVLKATGDTGSSGMVTAIIIGTVICIISAMAGDTSQDLKTGYLVGATPVKQQVGELFGVAAAGLSIAGIMYLLNSAWGFGGNELPAPQATLMKMVVEGVMNADLPWVLVFIGVFFSITVEVLGISAMPVAIGLYLPIHLSMGVMTGAVVRWFIERKKFNNEEDRERVLSNGVIYSSGMIAGEGLVGILLAALAVIPIGKSTMGQVIDISGHFSIGQIGSLLMFALLLLSILKFSLWNKKLYTDYEEKEK